MQRRLHSTGCAKAAYLQTTQLHLHTRLGVHGKKVVHDLVRGVLQQATNTDGVNSVCGVRGAVEDLQPVRVQAGEGKPNA